MVNKINDFIVEHIEKKDYDESMKSFLKKVLEFELDWQVIYDENDKQGRHIYTEQYKSFIDESLGD